MKQPSETDWAYLAGVIDSDGSIILTPVNPKKQPNSLRPIVSITNRDFAMLKWIKDTFGGWLSTINHPSLGRPRWRIAYVLQISYKQGCRGILQGILPFLKVKQRQAEIVLEFTNRPNHIKYTSEEWQLYHKVKELNMRGNQP